MPETEDNPFKLKGDAPKQANVTPYDRAHLATYLSLLHASGEGLSLDEIARDILNLHPQNAPVCTRTIVENHLARARWLATSGLSHLLESDEDDPIDGLTHADKPPAR